MLRCWLETTHASPSFSRHSPDSLLSLHLLGMSSMPSLPRLLSALLPESMHLQRLAIISCSADAAAMLGCTQLNQLQELSIGTAGAFALGTGFDDLSAHMASGTLEQALDALLQQTPRLRCLELSNASQPAAGFQQGTVPTASRLAAAWSGWCWSGSGYRSCRLATTSQVGPECCACLSCSALVTAKQLAPPC